MVVKTWIKTLLAIVVQIVAATSSDYTDGNEDDESELKELPPEEEFLKLSNIPTSQSFQALPLICRSSEFIKSTRRGQLKSSIW